MADTLATLIIKIPKNFSYIDSKNPKKSIPIIIIFYTPL